jgi:NAD(P)H-flavin reductase
MANLPGTEVVEFVAKHFPAGRATPRLFELKPGETVTMEMPFGVAYLQETQRDLVLAAGGTGISSILGLVRELVVRERMPGRGIKVFYGSRTVEELACIEELYRLAALRPGLEIIPVVMAPPDSWEGERGLITEAMLRLLPDLTVYDYYMSGPPPMIRAALDMLFSASVSVLQIHYDSFG